MSLFRVSSNAEQGVAPQEVMLATVSAPGSETEQGDP